MKNYVAEIANAFTYVLAALQANEVFQIVELCLSIATSAVLIMFRLWKWYKTAKADGKITSDEIMKGVQIIIDGEEEIKSQIDGEDKREEIKKMKGK